MSRTQMDKPQRTERYQRSHTGNMVRRDKLRHLELHQPGCIQDACFCDAQRVCERARRRSDQLGWLSFEDSMHELRDNALLQNDEWELAFEGLGMYDPYSSMADWERELLGEEAVPPPIEYTVGAHEPSYPYDEGKYWDDEVLVGNHGSYSVVGGIHHLNPGYGLDAVFGEAYLGGNCGFSVKTRP